AEVGQEDGELSPLVEPGGDPQDAAGVGHDAVYDGESQPAAFVGPLRGEEWIENVLDDLGGDAGPVIGHAEQDVRTRREVLRVLRVVDFPGRDADANRSRL